MYEDKTLVIAEGIILCCRRSPLCSIYVSSSHLLHIINENVCVYIINYILLQIRRIISLDYAKNLTCPHRNTYMEWRGIV